jgi:formylglycine-generating enzyme required for sulfatase activity
MEFMCVPSGKFIMGSQNGNDKEFDPDSHIAWMKIHRPSEEKALEKLAETYSVTLEKPQHLVDISYDYWMARYLITNEQYEVYVKDRGIPHPVDGWEKKSDHPVVNVSWQMAVEYCQWLTGVLASELSANLIFRLPTGAEWEKSARGTDGREFPWGNVFENDKCALRKDSKTAPVGLYSPQGDSPFACADMVGNVYQWTHSRFVAYPYNAKDGREDEKMNLGRESRGGVAYKYWMRCSYRHEYHPDSRNGVLGFRVCIAPPLQ